jgi:hypothetical protein
MHVPPMCTKVTNPITEQDHRSTKPTIFLRAETLYCHKLVINGSTKTPVSPAPSSRTQSRLKSTFPGENHNSIIWQLPTVVFFTLSVLIRFALIIALYLT